MVCKKCGKDIPDNALFCGYCGEKCVGQNRGGRVCKVCGAELMQNVQYCHVCGAGIENNTKINEVEPDKEKVLGDEKYKLSLLIIIGVCIGLMLGSCWWMLNDEIVAIVMFVAALIGIIYGTFCVRRAYHNSNKQIKKQDIVICVVFAIISLGTYMVAIY